MSVYQLHVAGLTPQLPARKSRFCPPLRRLINDATDISLSSVDKAFQQGRPHSPVATAHNLNFGHNQPAAVSRRNIGPLDSCGRPSTP